MASLGTLENLSEELFKELPKAKGDRRDFLKAGLSAGLATLLPTEAEARSHYSRIPVPNVGYEPLAREINLKGVRVADDDSDIGRIERVLRWANITKAVEDRYGIAPNLLLGMICVESEGNPAQPNARGDGGAGFIHMQPKLATKYGLRLISPSTRLRDYEQGRLLREAVKKTKGDLKQLIVYDDRFHPIKNIDAAARMLADNFQGSGRSWNRALERYAGRRTYDSKVIKYAKFIGDAHFMAKVRADFSQRNRNFVIGGGPLDFDSYTSIFHQLNRNYGLDEYTKLRKHPVQFA